MQFIFIFEIELSIDFQYRMTESGLSRADIITIGRRKMPVADIPPNPHSVGNKQYSSSFET